MDTSKARSVLNLQLQPYRSRTYTDLTLLIGSLEAYEVPNDDGHPYQVEIEVFWDWKPGGDIRVMGAIDDGGWSAFSPLTEDFLVAAGPDPVGS